MLYCGPLGNDAKDLISYFENLGLDRISPGYNAATWMLENTTILAEEKWKVDFSEAFQDSKLKRRGSQITVSAAAAACVCLHTVLLLIFHPKKPGGIFAMHARIPPCYSCMHA